MKTYSVNDVRYLGNVNYWQEYDNRDGDIRKKLLNGVDEL